MFEIDVDTELDLETIHKLVTQKIKVGLSEAAKKRITSSREKLEGFIRDGNVVYGVNTGMGSNVDRLIPLKDASQLQINLLRAVATNVGDLVEDEIVLASMLARIVSLSRGNSAIQLGNLNILVEMFNARITPLVHKKGSLGTSGDLGPLASIALVGIGEWKAKVDNTVYSGIDALNLCEIKPMKLEFKEGLALINGTSAMVGLGSMNIVKAKGLIDNFIHISTISAEAFGAKIKPFDPRVHMLKPHIGQRDVAMQIHKNLSESEMITDDDDLIHRLKDETSEIDVTTASQPLEDCYSIRCTPQIVGPTLDALVFIEKTIVNELNSSNDNPLIDPISGEIYHNGHFHGQYVASAMDFLSMNLITLANLSSARINKYLDSGHSHGLPPSLCMSEAGLNFGLMGIEFMSASVTAEMRAGAIPISVQSLNTTGGFQDVVSFGFLAARKTEEHLQNLAYVMAAELICACQAADIKGTAQLSPQSAMIHKFVRNIVPYVEEDTVLMDQMQNLSSKLYDRLI